MKNNKIILAGGSGFIGQALAKFFGKDNEIVILGRQSGDLHSNSYSRKTLTRENGYNIRYVKWNVKSVEESWSREFNGADLVINLAGKSVNCRYHKKQKQEILDSRIDATTAIGEAINQVATKPRLWINVASATIYKNSLDKPNDEYTGTISDRKKDNMPYNVIDHLRDKKKKLVAALRYGKNSVEYKETDRDFSIKVCKRWEQAFLEQKTAGTRKVILRAAITLGEGGVIIPYFNLCKFGLGGKHGNGRQMYSWVHVEDVARMIDWLFERKESEGVYNCAAPHAVTNSDFMKTLRKATSHPFGLPAYSWMLEAGAFFIGTETELMLKSRWVIPERAIREGFRFRYDFLEAALCNIVSNMPPKKYKLY